MSQQAIRVPSAVPNCAEAKAETQFSSVGTMGVCGDKSIEHGLSLVDSSLDCDKDFVSVPLARGVRRLSLAGF